MKISGYVPGTPTSVLDLLDVQPSCCSQPGDGGSGRMKREKKIFYKEIDNEIEEIEGEARRRGFFSERFV